MMVGMFGTAIFYGDGVITPAISVLGAVEGLSVVAPALSSWVLPLSLVVIVGLFAVQRLGTGSIGKAFGPITLVWFVVLTLLGLPHIAANPEVLQALNPGLRDRLLRAAQAAWPSSMLGAVVLCVTGGEALYADMGHFGKRADPHRLVRHRDAGAGDQLLRPGRDAAAAAGEREEPVLPDGAATGPRCRCWCWPPRRR